MAEYFCQIDKLRQDVCDYEKKFIPLVLANKEDAKISTMNNRTYFDKKSSKFCPLSYMTALFKKGHFVLVMLQKKCGEEEFLKVIYNY